jgi:hypothetical protein
LAAGIVVALASPREHGEALRHKLEGIGFGFFVRLNMHAYGKIVTLPVSNS